MTGSPCCAQESRTGPLRPGHHREVALSPLDLEQRLGLGHDLGLAEVGAGTHGGDCRDAVASGAEGAVGNVGDPVAQPVGGRGAAPAPTVWPAPSSPVVTPGMAPDAVVDGIHRLLGVRQLPAGDAPCLLSPL